MSKSYRLKLTKCEIERLLDDCLDLAEGDEIYFGDNEKVCEVYSNILDKLRRSYYGKDFIK